MNSAFVFHNCLFQSELLGRRARNLAELRQGIAQVPNASIYHHTHRRLQQHIRLSPEPPNDFAYWTKNSLGALRTAEALASIPMASYRSLDEVRAGFLAVLDSVLAEANGFRPDAPPGMEFHFFSMRLFVLPTPTEARTIGEFRDGLSRVPIESIQYHVFASRLGLAPPEHGFTGWLESIGQSALAEVYQRMDPYTLSLESLRKMLVRKAAAHAEA
ncbi:MAG: hypothetical protein JXB39_04195 [Deltaproteobacteria bacterium]|nr:hypothetical protein [Deltaproteobacteria bacterium]